MESVPLDMDDLFDERNDAEVEEDFAMPPPMPDLEVDEGAMEAGQSQQDGEDDDEVQRKLRDMSKGAAKKRVMRPQPKLDAARLKGERGLPILPKLFSEVNFHGKGHEASDLKLMMGKLEHWAHRLFPKMTFDEFIMRLEKLGGKKEVQNCVKRIRLDMPLLDEDFISQTDDGPAEEENQSMQEPADEITEMDAEDAFEEMIRQERERAERNKQQEEEEDEFMASMSAPSTPLTVNTPKVQKPSSDTPQKPNSAVPATQITDGGITAEQRERMERNKRLAMERRMKKLGRTPIGNKTSIPATGSNPSTLSESTPSTSRNEVLQSTQPEKGKEIPKDDMQTEEEIMASLLDQEENMDSEQETNTVQSSNRLQLVGDCNVGSNGDGKISEEVGKEIAGAESEGLQLKLSVSDSDVTQSDSADVNSTIDSVMMDEAQSENLNLQLLSPTQGETEKLELHLSEVEPTAMMDGDVSEKVKSNTQNSDEVEKLNNNNEKESLKLKMTQTQSESEDPTMNQSNKESLNLKLTETETMEVDEIER